MGLLDFFRGPDINQGIEEWKQHGEGVLLDVRGIEEFGRGHIPGSINFPFSNIKKIGIRVPNKNTSIWVYCLSGARSNQAVRELKKMGYTAVKDIGGINRYKGEIRY